MIDPRSLRGLTPPDAERLQRALAQQVRRTDDLPPVRRVAGVDVAYADDGDLAIAAVAVLDAATLAPVEVTVAEERTSFPYIPNLFSFRELPPVLAALAKLQTPPDLIICDGQGIAHPRRFGLACHLGVLADVPTIGCAKSRLLGAHDEPAPARGARAPLTDGNEVVGAVLRTQDGVRPLYVSIGHRVGLDTACDWVLRLSSRFRLPETTRVADHAVRMALGARAPAAGGAPR